MCGTWHTGCVQPTYCTFAAALVIGPKSIAIVGAVTRSAPSPKRACGVRNNPRDCRGNQLRSGYFNCASFRSTNVRTSGASVFVASALGYSACCSNSTSAAFQNMELRSVALHSWPAQVAPFQPAQTMMARGLLRRTRPGRLPSSVLLLIRYSGQRS